FKYTLSLVVIQSLSAAIGIVLTVIFATLSSSVFLKNKKIEEAAK
ncbi:YibE/F family protein, partial [Lactobacillus gasseri]|nr:YibE/F family protein [Lactobacillus gasseri]